MSYWGDKPHIQVKYSHSNQYHITFMGYGLDGAIDKGPSITEVQMQCLCCSASMLSCCPCVRTDLFVTDMHIC